MSKVSDLTGQCFGRLTVVERAGSNKRGHAMWKCRCDCGNEVIVVGYSLTGGKSKSCGCSHHNKIVGGRNRKHGLRYTRLYGVWFGMKARCYNPHYNEYQRYGGRGITICDEWREDFQAFHDWAMANGYDETAPYGQCTIDRIDNDKGYSPDNCRWVDLKTQRNNRSHSGPLPKLNFKEK